VNVLVLLESSHFVVFHRTCTSVLELPPKFLISGDEYSNTAVTLMKCLE